MKKIKNIGTHIFLIIASILSLFPFLWMLIGMTNKSVDITQGKLTIGNELMINIQKLFEQTQFGNSFIITLKIALVGTIASLFVCSLAGYAFVIYKSKVKDIILSVIMISMMIPFSAVMIPLFKMFSVMKLLNTELGIILPSIATAFMIFFFVQNTKNFPKELLQAARVDGIGEFKAFFKIYMPSMKAVYAAGSIIVFMNYWNSFLWPLIVLQGEEKKTLPLLISSLLASHTPDYGLIMVSVVAATFPTMLIFFVMQKYFVQGLIGAIK